MPENEQDSRALFPDKFSSEFFSRYPEWKEYQIEPNLRWQSKYDLAVEIPSRFAPYCPFRVETMSDGIIIYWVGYHVHCDDWGGKYTEEEFIAKAFDIIDKILSEELVIVLDWNDVSMPSGALFSSETLDAQLQTGSWPKPREGHTTLVVSWNGSYDRGEFDPAMLKTRV